ncbi:MAG: deoxyguanosinetriphosphate triphosphohydrolase family protein [Sphaerochaetaceae bacterium]|jgi:dGTPase
MALFKNEISDELLKTRAKPRSIDVRGDYYRDTTAILHSSSFRRLKHKTQVFFAPSNDHICTRMEHVLHVASVASAICRALNLDTELAWAIGMGHDLGHTPFGHVGEVIIDNLMKERNLEPFEHEMNSMRVIDFLANNGNGLNLTYAVRNGIASHNGEVFVSHVRPDFKFRDLSELKSRKNATCATWEAAVVRFSDQIAYLGRDFEDACRLAIIEKDSLPENVAKTLGKTNAEIINTLVNDLIDNSTPNKGIAFSDEIFASVVEMKEFNYKNIYKSPQLEGYSNYFSRLINLIVTYLEDLFKTYEFDQLGYRNEKNMLAVGFILYLTEMKEKYLKHDGSYDYVVFDYVAGMSDNFALDCVNEILKPEHLNMHIEHSLTGKWFDVNKDLL